MIDVASFLILYHGCGMKRELIEMYKRLAENAFEEEGVAWLFDGFPFNNIAWPSAHAPKEATIKFVECLSPEVVLGLINEIEKLNVRNARLIKELEKCRDAFGEPEAGSPQEVDWTAAVNDIDSVSGYVKRSVDLMRLKQVRLIKKD